MNGRLLIFTADVCVCACFVKVKLLNLTSVLLCDFYAKFVTVFYIKRYRGLGSAEFLRRFCGGSAEVLRSFCGVSAEVSAEAVLKAN